MTGFRFTHLFILFYLLPALLSAQEDQDIDWIYEIDLLGKELAQKHCDLFFKSDSTAFINAFSQIAEEASMHSLFYNSLKLQQAIVQLGDPQTRINYHFNIDGSSILPLDLYWFEDGIHIMKCRKEDQAIVGKRLTGINGYPLEQIIDSLATLLVNENDYLLKSQLPRMLTWTPLLDHFGFSGQKEYELQYELEKGKIARITIPLYNEPGEEVSVQPKKLPLGWQDRKSYFRDQYFPEERIYYIQYNKCWSREVEEDYGTGASALFMPSFKEFEKKVFLSLRKEEIDKFVIDMRFNDGGNIEQGERFIKKIGKFRLNGRGKFYVIVGRETAASAIIHTLDLVRNFDAVIVGEGTGGSPNHFGEVKRFVLPETRLVVNYSTKYFKLTDENASSILPLIESPLHFSDFMRGTDTAMEAIRNDILN